MISTRSRQSSIPNDRATIARCGAAIAAFVVALGLLTPGVVGAAAGTATVDGAATASQAAASPQNAIAAQSDNVSEEAYVESAPERGDKYYEATDPNGDWISYVNPRDEYRNPYLGEGSGKICVTLLNEAGDPIVGETVPNTSVVIPTGDNLSWHSQADPMVVDLPLTDNYERPLDADQFGTDPNVIQGDGYMDSHCIEMHGHPEDITIKYGQASVQGEHADEIDVVGYIEQQPGGDGWDTGIDPIEAAESYEEVGGSWTYEPNASHGQVVAVLQLDRNGNQTDPASDDDGTANESDGETDDNDSDAESDGSQNDGLPGMGVLAALVALTIAALLGRRR
ncbi:PGF-CTERM sorting domain-containing protein [Halosolutus gelatinilyticus]|uniref:PGF-CTERM sorting domain-containing protein n=1 Tax=Halosolutus gelatinilyticus TaxID=2931975 RepID=UPI001FF130F8|nr:PGF-CTERM sorting domain-containing protein [Halosolutus gelatinilyticus]